MSITHKEFKLELPTNGAVSIALIGASRSGKTTMLRHIYHTYFPTNISVIFTMNPQADIYKSFSRRMIVSELYHPELLREAHEFNRLSDNKWPFLFISDDYVDMRIKTDAEITRALTIYRNSNISTIFSFQGRTLMSAVGRNNINYVAIFKQNSSGEYENVIKEFLGMWLPTDMTMREAIEFVRKATEDHHFFFIDNIKGECYISKLTIEQRFS
jgi:GTPase SAR1 family protein